MLTALKERYDNWRLSRHPIPDDLWIAALRRQPYACLLPAPRQQQLRRLTNLFLLDKHFSAAHKLAVNDEMRLTVAINACVPILELGLGCYSAFRGIVLYPADFRTLDRRVDDAGVVHEEMRELCGQAQSHGPMVLSWDSIVHEHPDNGRNVVIHECAHKLDMLNGEADGFPPLAASISHAEWTRVFSSAYLQLNRDVENGYATGLDPYGAEDEAEFFAVASETFFTRPDIVYDDFPQVYKLLTAFYRQNPYAVFVARMRTKK